MIRKLAENDRTKGFIDRMKLRESNGVAQQQNPIEVQIRRYFEDVPDMMRACAPPFSSSPVAFYRE